MSPLAASSPVPVDMTAGLLTPVSPLQFTPPAPRRSEPRTVHFSSTLGLDSSLSKSALAYTTPAQNAPLSTLATAFTAPSTTASAPKTAVGKVVHLISNNTVTVTGSLQPVGDLSEEIAVSFAEMQHKAWVTGPKAQKRLVGYKNKGSGPGVPAVLVDGVKNFKGWEVIIAVLPAKTLKAVPMRNLSNEDGL